jgi:TPR repeat protein
MNNETFVRPLRHALFAATLGITLETAYAGQLEDGVSAWGQGEFASAMSLLEPLADEGQPRAQFLVGLMFTTGDGVDRDIPAGVAWFRKSAEQGNVDSMYSLGQEYSLKELVDGRELFPEDYAEAYFWFSLAAEGYAASGREKQAGAREMRDMMERRLSPAEVESIKARIAAWNAAH